MPPPAITLELRSPQTVDGRRAPYQSLWLLLRLLHGHAQGEAVRLDDLRGRLCEPGALRMAISRAFRDFQAWGIVAGWGEDGTRDPRFLNAAGRSQGPFWLPAAQARRLKPVVDGRRATRAEVAAFLGLKPQRTRAAAAPQPPADAVHLQDAHFWQQLVTAHQAMQQGRLAVSPTAGGEAGGPSALEAMRRAGRLAGSGFQRALVTLNEALLWRRLGDDAEARKRLKFLQRQRLAAQVAGHEYLGAMAAIVAAWCDYAARDLAEAQAQLRAVAEDPAHGPLLRHHPQVRFEWHNLWALACRSQALAMAADAARREAAAAQAEEALRHFDRALAAAFVSHAFDAAQHVAANMGMALWLFDRVGLAVDGTRREGEALRRAVQWIAFSEWLCRQAEVQGRSAWNAIYLLRIARGGCTAAPRLPLADFRALRPLRMAQAAALAGPLADGFAPAQWPADWVAVARQRLEEHASGRRRYPGLQRASLLFELAWHAAHGGDLREAAAALAALRGELPALPAADRAYFREVWNDALPAELLALEPPPRRAAR